MAGVNPRHFLGGGMCREEATSAFLATLLDQSAEFRKRFFQLCGIPPFKVKEVVVEQAQRDVTIVGENVFAIIENKIDSGSKTEGQLLGYYRGFKEENAGAQVHSVYLAPNRQLGESEVKLIDLDAGEIAIAVAWSDLQPLCKALGDFDNEFAESGVDCVLEAIQRRKLRPSREWDEDELVLREMVRSMMHSLQPRMPHRNLTVYACQLWASGAITVTVDLKVCEREAEVPEISLSVTYSFNLSTQRHDDIPFAKTWIGKIKNEGRWEAFAIDAENKWMNSAESMRGEPPQLEQAITTKFYNLVTTIDQAVSEEKSKAQVN